MEIIRKEAKDSYLAVLSSSKEERVDKQQSKAQIIEKLKMDRKIYALINNSLLNIDIS